jgi:ubiquinol-cytochrome c reductase cytochrome b subunit
VDNPTLKRFFILHFLLPLILAMITAVHLALLHADGSTNPLGVDASFDYLRFYPKFFIKDIFGMLIVIGPILGVTIFAYPNVLGHPDNYIKADALVTPRHIVPE